MLLRKLRKNETVRTRELWEKIFTEDTPEFLDYYYSQKTEDNEIYVIEREGYICSMLHLNPYTLQMGSREEASRYIVAVATDEAYRKRKYMTELLQKSVRDLYLLKVPFVFLMPADYHIYYPHNYRYIYDMPQWKAVALDDRVHDAEELNEMLIDDEVEIRPAKQDDCKEMAVFAESVLSEKYQVYTKRDFLYYHRLLLEQESQNGGILIAKEKGKIRGLFCYAQETELVVREPLIQPGYEDVFDRIGFRVEIVERKPLIMGRVVNAETLISTIQFREETKIQFVLVDPVIRENNKIFIVHGNKEHTVVRTKPLIKGKYEELPLISVDALISSVFGYKEISKIEEEEKEVFADDLRKALENMIPFKNIFINEVV